MPSIMGHLSSITNVDGKELHLRGTVRAPSGKPKADVIVYIYHTDAQGNYLGASATQPHGHLRAWVRTDARGRYGFDTIRPASYPAQDGSTREPARIHMHLLEPGRCSYYLDDLLFSDDPQPSASRCWPEHPQLFRVRHAMTLQQPHPRRCFWRLTRF